MGLLSALLEIEFFTNKKRKKPPSVELNEGPSYITFRVSLFIWISSVVFCPVPSTPLLNGVASFSFYPFRSHHVCVSP